MLIKEILPSTNKQKLISEKLFKEGNGKLSRETFSSHYFHDTRNQTHNKLFGAEFRVWSTVLLKAANYAASTDPNYVEACQNFLKVPKFCS